MTSLLFRFRGEILSLWGIAVLAWGWPPRGWAPSVVLLVAGLALRAWSRRHIGPHSRLRTLACPERSATGPYRFLAHPLYAANLLVITSLALAIAGPRFLALAMVLGPALLYVLLARAETAYLAHHAPPIRTIPHTRHSGGWHSEWASMLPQATIWGILQFWPR